MVSQNFLKDLHEIISTDTNVHCNLYQKNLIRALWRAKGFVTLGAFLTET